jgi:hypothetical protein
MIYVTLKIHVAGLTSATTNVEELFANRTHNHKVHAFILWIKEDYKHACGIVYIRKYMDFRIRAQSTISLSYSNHAAGWLMMPGAAGLPIR